MESIMVRNMRAKDTDTILKAQDIIKTRQAVTALPTATRMHTNLLTGTAFVRDMTKASEDTVVLTAEGAAQMTLITGMTIPTTGTIPTIETIGIVIMAGTETTSIA